MTLEEQIAFTKLESDFKEALSIIAAFERAHTEFKYVTVPMLQCAAEFYWKHASPRSST